MKERTIVAIDVATKEAARHLISEFREARPSIKIGMELFYQTGPAFIYELKEVGYDIFLDLKLHDIPTTVFKAMKGLASLGVDMVNVHASGGKAMMRAAVEGLEEGTASGKKRPLCVAVTQLTSTDDAMLQKELLISKPLKEVVVSYSQMAHESGLDGVVCSPWEVREIKNATDKQHFITVTPGIRLEGDGLNDQKRVATPSQAKELGSDYIVVGRSITHAKDPFEAFRTIKRDFY